MKIKSILTPICAAMLVISSCNQPANSEGQVSQDSIEDTGSYAINIVSTEVENPWGITWINNEEALITEKSGKILLLKNDEIVDSLSGVPSPYLNGQSGYLDIIKHPNYDDNGWIYITYSKKSGDGGSTTLARFKIDGNQATDWEDIYQTMPITSGPVHFGSRIIFDNDGYLYFSTGERGVKENAQNLKNDMGKVHRLKDDGQIPEDNPFYNTTDAKKSIWTYGNRNVQGMVYDAENNLIYATEHGPQGGDELNLIKKGVNYGWPVITYGIDYDGSVISDLQEKEGMEQPLHYWTPSIAACGLLFYTGDKFPQWKNNIFAGALAKMHVTRIELEDGKYKQEEKMLENKGRVRQISQSPEGYIYILTEGPGQVIKLSPAK